MHSYGLLVWSALLEPLRPFWQHLQRRQSAAKQRQQQELEGSQHSLRQDSVKSATRSNQSASIHPPLTSFKLTFELKFHRRLRQHRHIQRLRRRLRRSHAQESRHLVEHDLHGRERRLKLHNLVSCSLSTAHLSSHPFILPRNLLPETHLTPPSDYLSGGSLTDATLLPSTSQIESFYKKQLFSAIINAQWRKRKIFTTFHRTNDSLSSSGPNATRYYSQKDGGVYYTYFYHESGTLKGYLDAPEGLAQLNESAWGISGGDISKASAASAKVGGFNYTEEMGRGALSEAIASNGSLSPWEDGAGWRGTWTMPVCDMG